MDIVDTQLGRRTSIDDIGNAADDRLHATPSGPARDGTDGHPATSAERARPCRQVRFGPRLMWTGGGGSERKKNNADRLLPKQKKYGHATFTQPNKRATAPPDTSPTTHRPPPPRATRRHYPTPDTIHIACQIWRYAWSRE